MKILAIKGHNIASLEDIDINFEEGPLASAGIFAIAGPTGSGKSTVLDVMCLALYAQTPRISQVNDNVNIRDVGDNTINQNNICSLMRRGTVSCFAEVDFVALDAKRYRARWSVARAYNNPEGKLQGEKFELWNLTLDERNPAKNKREVLAEIEKLIGLSFTQFTRTVLLAQNEFATFLKASGNDKAELLEKLTGTQIYSSISRKVYENNKSVAESYNRIKSEIDDIKLLGEEEFASLLESDKAIDVKLNELKEQKEKQRNLQQNVSHLLTTLQDKKNTLANAVKDFDKSHETLRRAEALFGNIDIKYNEVSAQTQALSAKLVEVRRLDQQVETALRDLLQASKVLVEAQKKKEENELAIARTSKEIAELTVTKQAIDDYFANNQKRRNVVEQYSALTLQLDNAGKLKDVLIRNESDIKEINKNISVSTAEIASLKKQYEEKLKEISEKENEREKLQKDFIPLDIENIDKQIEELRLQRDRKQQELFKSVREIRAKLEENVPCPVCGSLHHPYADSALIATSRDIDVIDAQIKNLDDRIKAYNQQNKQIEELKTRVLKLRSEAIVIDGKQNVAVASLANHQEKHIKETATISDNRKSFDEIIGVIDGMFTNNDWQKGWMENPESFKKSVSGFVSKWKSQEELLKQTQQTLSMLSERLSGLNGQHPAITKSFDEAVNNEKGKNDILQTLQAERKTYWDGRKADEVENEHNEKLKELKKQREQIERTKIEALANKSEMEGKIKGFNEDIEIIQIKLANAQKDIEDWGKKFLEAYDGEDIDRLIKRTTEEKGETSHQIKMQEEHRKQVDAKREKLNKAYVLMEQWGKLNSLIGSFDGKKFKMLVQVYTLEYLIQHANYQLRMLNPRYSLQCVPGQLALEIVDHDMCEEIRSVHTLSGGESFLVSLALAIGLSSLTSNDMNVESLFIDEGFGSLDADTLRTAMEALENLQMQGKKIGVISHVQEMTERIPVQIRVKRQGNGKSCLEVVG